MIIPGFGSEEEYERLASLSVTMYGQMTAGSFMYIGPQGIVHGTTLTLLNAGRLYLNTPDEGNLAGKVFVTSGLGGMSGAQAKAAVITGAVGVIAEINPHAARKRHEQGWVQELSDDLDHVVKRIEQAKRAKEPLSLAYVGNIVDLWERLATADVEIELGSDQTSLHIPFTGGYYPAGLSFEEASTMIKRDPKGFREQVQSSLRRHFAAIQKMSERGMFFWDYGNAFLVQAHEAGAQGVIKGDGSFIYPSYVEDIMGPICFDYGFGPFRWIATSNKPEDLKKSDEIAARVLEQQLASAPADIKQQIADNLYWIKQAQQYEMVVGLQARILYSDAEGRMAIAKAFNDAIRDGEISAPITLGRDHHDVSGTDSPYRETANIYDGSNRCADMAIQNVIGDAARGATWVSIHNGGGVGWSKAMNGGFGLVLDGSKEAERRLQSMLFWDVNNGIARRAWAGNANAIRASQRAMAQFSNYKVTLPHAVDPTLLNDL
jgi:urocanate hydratase